jgi:hypothetical protein
VVLSVKWLAEGEETFHHPQMTPIYSGYETFFVIGPINGYSALLIIQDPKLMRA